MNICRLTSNPYRKSLYVTQLCNQRVSFALSAWVNRDVTNHERQSRYFQLISRKRNLSDAMLLLLTVKVLTEMLNGPLARYKMNRGVLGNRDLLVKAYLLWYYWLFSATVQSTRYNSFTSGRVTQNVLALVPLRCKQCHFRRDTTGFTIQRRDYRNIGLQLQIVMILCVRVLYRKLFS
jgi:hypothetical protein